MRCTPPDIDASPIPPRSGRPAGARPAGVPVLDSAVLLGGERMVVIVHGAETYRLQVTRSGKLILTK